METRRQFAPSFADEILRISTLLDPRFAFLDKIASTDEWKAIVEILVEIKCTLHVFSILLMLRYGPGISVSDSAAAEGCSQPDPSPMTSREQATSFWDILAETSEEEPQAKRCLLSTHREEMMVCRQTCSFKNVSSCR